MLFKYVEVCDDNKSVFLQACQTSIFRIKIRINTGFGLISRYKTGTALLEHFDRNMLSSDKHKR
jgi:hypothetical protein